MTQERHFKFWPKHLPRHLSAPATALGFNLEVSATRYPDKTALIFYDNKISYSQLRKEVDALAGYLQQECGVRKGDRVLLDMQNCPQFVIGYYAILRANAVVVPISPMNVTDELIHYLEDSGAITALIGQEVYKQFRYLIGTKLEHLIVASYADYLPGDSDITVPVFMTEQRLTASEPGVVRWVDALAAGCTPQPQTVQANDLAAILYTSGTTGKPKGCVHTHHSIMTTLVIRASQTSENQASAGMVCSGIAMKSRPAIGSIISAPMIRLQAVTTRGSCFRQEARTAIV